MATSAKTTKSKLPTSSNSGRRPAPRRGTTTPSRRSEPSSPRRLVRRVQAILSGAKRNAKPNPAESLAAGLERAAGGATAVAPLTKGKLGIVGGGAGAVTGAKRRCNLGPNELPATSSAQATNPGAGDTRQSPDTIADPSATTGGNHGDSQGPDPATAA
jgi:hypothetical protein